MNQQGGREREQPDRCGRSQRGAGKAHRAAALVVDAQALAIASALLLLGWAWPQLNAARAGYLRLALFHGHLETVAFALLLLEGELA